MMFHISVFILYLSLSCAQKDYKVLLEPSDLTIARKVSEYFLVSCICETSESEKIKNITWTGPHGEIYTSGPGDVEILMNLPNKLYLIFNKPTTDDTGKYTCFASFGETYTKESSINITFFDLSFEECPQRQAIVVKKHGKIRCRVNARPPATTRWFKNNTGIDTARFSVASDGISVFEVAEEDGGNYTFEALVPTTGQLYKFDIDVEVYVSPKIIRFKQIYQFIEGDRMELYCKATGNPPSKYYWTNRNKQNLSHVVGYSVNPDTGLLTIQKIERDDTGYFGCLAVNSVDSDYLEAYVTVIIPPNIVYFYNQSVLLGLKAVLKCSVYSSPNPIISIRKKVENRPFDHYFSRYDFNSMSEGKDQVLALTVFYTTKDDAGIYFCESQNEGGRVVKAAYLQIRYPPDMSLTTTRWKKTWKEHPVNLSCVADAIPSATITWSLRGLPIVSSELYHIYSEASYSNLLVKPLSRVKGGTDVYGKYRCEATNRHGINFREIDLTEARAPAKILLCNVSSSTATTITFSLLGPRDDGGLDIKQFVVEFREKDEENSTNKRQDWFGGSSYILRDLKPRTAYIFRFAAVNDAGIGQFNEFTEFDTSSDSSPEIPSFIIQSGTNISRFSDSYQVLWSVPENNGNEIEFFELRLLEVEFEGIENEKRYTIDKWVNATHFNITSLKPNTSYQVELLAKNQNGYSYSAFMLFKTSVSSKDKGQKLQDNSAKLDTAAQVTIIIIFVALVVGSCYLCIQFGVFHRLRTTVCGGRSRSYEVVGRDMIEVGKNIKTHQRKKINNQKNDLDATCETSI